MFVVCDNRSCMHNIRGEINYDLGNRPLVVFLTKLTDMQLGELDGGDRIWVEVKQKTNIRDLQEYGSRRSRL